MSAVSTYETDLAVLGREDFWPIVAFRGSEDACAQVEEGSPRGTVQEIRRKASKIAPAYNKGALQYLPDEKGD